MKSILTSILLILMVSASAQQDTLKVGIVLFKSEEKVEQTFRPLMNYVASELDMQAEIQIIHEDDLAFYLEEGSIDIGIFTVFPYLKEKKDFPNLKVFATHHVKGKDHYYGSILVSNESGIKTWQDIAGKKAAFVKPTSTSGFMYPNGILLEHGIVIEDDMDYDFVGGHEEAIRALAKNEVDLISVNETRFNKVEGISKADFIELERFKVPHHAYTFSSKLSAEEKNKIKKIFKEAHRDPANDPLWENPIGITKWELKNDEYYNPIRRYLRINRIKPEVEISLKATNSAKSELDNLLDIKRIVIKRIRRFMAESKRFSNENTHSPEYKMIMTISATGDHFSYRVNINGDYIADGEVSKDSILAIVPIISYRALLKKAEIETDLLYNGEEWFITFGFNDGINLQDYEFLYTDKTGRQFLIDNEDLEKIDNLSVFFEEQKGFYKGAPILIRYGREISPEDEEDLADIDTYNFFSKQFWKQNYWDKLGLIGGIVVAIISAIIGKIVTSRKKKRFKNILTQTNSIIKEYIDGQYKLESRLIEQQDRISSALEEGHINENQFLILKQRIADMQNIVDIHQKGDIKINDTDISEISDIVGDGTVTEKDFSRIMSILSKSRAS